MSRHPVPPRAACIGGSLRRGRRERARALAPACYSPRPMALVRFPYKQDADTLYRFLTDEGEVKTRCEALGEREVRVSKAGHTITNRRLVEAEIPAFAKKLFSPTNTVEDTAVWDPSKKTARFTVDVKGAPARIGGTIALVETGKGTDYVIDFEVTCKIPFIGGKVEAFVAEATEKALRAEFEYNKKTLDGR
jgi:hypothetical protein